MTITDWVQVNSEWIALAYSILVLVGLGYYIVKRRRLGVLTFFLVLWGLLALYYVIDIAGLSRSNQLPPADWAQIWGQILLLGGLLVVTTAYAYSTEKMAEEMREQRYNAVRPIIDMQWEHSTDTLALGEAASLEPEHLSHYVSDGLKCILHNIGLGPAIDVYSFAQGLPSERWRCDFGTLAIGEKTTSRHLSLDQEGDRMFLRAYYKDVYGRTFESSRDVIILKERSRALGSLQIRLVEEK